MSDVADIFRKYRHQLQRFIVKRVSSKEDSEDILQDVFYRLSKIDMEENPIQSISSWLYAVARNLIIDRSRKRGEEELFRHPEADDDHSLVEELTQLIFDDEASPELDYAKALVWEELAVALSELPVEQRTVFELTELQGFSFRDISESTGVTVNTLISRKRRAVLHLRKRLAGLYSELFG